MPLKASVLHRFQLRGAANMEGEYNELSLSQCGVRHSLPSSNSFEAVFARSINSDQLYVKQ
jgi:hypothetical protein